MQAFLPLPGMSGHGLGGSWGLDSSALTYAVCDQLSPSAQPTQGDKLVGT
jgi:hypothetical protein